MDGRRFINAMLTSDKVEPITHVIINLPNDAAEFLDIVSALLLEYTVMGVVVLAIVIKLRLRLQAFMLWVMCFCGVGPIAISATKLVKRVYAIDLNPQEVDYIEMNSVLNKIESKIEGCKDVGATFWKTTVPNSLELAVLDSEGTRMWCTVPQLMIKSVKMKVKENGVYVLQNFFVGLRTIKPNQTRVSAQKYKINFQQNTSIIATDDHDFPPTQFHIRSCADVLNRNGVNEVDLIDVLGLLVTKHDIVPF
ncbi:hypothetical protein ACFE04_018153 [Oxalis oulophora]